MRVTFITLLLALSILAFAETARYGIQDNPGKKVPGNIELVNVKSDTVFLSDILDKPTLLNFVYYSCQGSCASMLEGIAEAINYTNSNPGTDYQVITISIDHNETPEQALNSKTIYFNQLSKEVSDDSWRFFISDSVSIKRLTDSVGWKFKNEGGEIIHPLATILLTPSGKVSQYFYGTYFNYVHFEMAIKDAWQEKVNPVRLKRMKYCYNYQLKKDRKTRFVTWTFGITVILIVLVLFLYLTVIPKKRNSI